MEYHFLPSSASDAAESAAPIAADVIIVGSGASAVHAAWPLVEAGLSVLMLHGGQEDERYAPRIAKQHFSELRRSDVAQGQWMLGERLEGVPFGPVRVGAQLTPPRQFITRHAERELPLETSLALAQSLATGGLGAGWGASAMPYNDREMADWPIGRADLQPHYDAVAKLVGICGPESDDLSDSVGPIDPLLPPARSDSNAQSILRRYQRHRARLNKRGFRAGRPRLAVVTKPFRGRGPLSYSDMEFWSDADRAVYRPRYTLEELRAAYPRHFRDERKIIVESYGVNESGDAVTVTGRFFGDSQEPRATWRAKRVVLAAGVLGTARIVLRSQNVPGPRPFVTNPYVYFPCVNWTRLGRQTRTLRHSLTQATAILDPDLTGSHDVQAQFYSYRSLLLFKLIKEAPLSIPEAIRLLSALSEYFVIAGVHHPDFPSPKKWLQLQPGPTPREDRLVVRHDLTLDERQAQAEAEARLKRCFLRIGLLPLRRIDPGSGASIHYGGPFPMTTNEADELTTDPQGRLRACPRVVIADGATFPDLPAKGPTFTLMANARRVGEALARELTQ